MNFNVILVFLTLVCLSFSQNEEINNTVAQDLEQNTEEIQEVNIVNSNPAEETAVIKETPVEEGNVADEKEENSENNETDTDRRLVVGEEVVVSEKTAAVCDVCECSENNVDCSEKEIRNIFDDGDWADLNDTEILDIDFSGNPLNILNILPDLPIHKLNLSRCDLGEIVDGAFRNLEELGSLDLSWNQLSTAAISRRIFGGTFEPGKRRPDFLNMRNLSLAHNDIHALPKDIFMFMTGLRKLDLSGNPLVAIDQVTMVALSDLKLTELSLAGCELESLPEGLLRRQRRLKRLDLSDNRFTTVPAVLGEATNLVYLNFDRNSLVNLTERTAISNLTKLQELHLCRNSKLQSISSGALGGLQYLTALYLTHNARLSAVETGFLAWEDEHRGEITPMLQQFHLNNNNLSTISYDFLTSWTQLTSADFSNNPYHCDCSSQWMVDVLVPLLQTIGGSAANMVCKRPVELGGLSFETLWQSNRTLSCVEVEAISDPGPDMAVLLGIMIGIFVTFPIVLIVVLLWKNGYLERCRRKIRSERVSYYDEDDAF